MNMKGNKIGRIHRPTSRPFLSLLIAFILVNNAGAQVAKNDYLSWSAVKKLSVGDFVIRKSNLPSSPCFAQFSMQFEGVNGFDWMKRNLNKKVHNYFIRPASWIDTAYDTSSSIRYQQTLFDICEIYTRQFRKALKENKRKIIVGSDFVNDLNAKAMSDFANRRLQYDNETMAGTVVEKHREWEKTIQDELAALKDYAIE